MKKMRNRKLDVNKFDRTVWVRNVFLKFCVQDFKERFDVATNGIQCLKRMLATCPRYPQKVRVTEEKRWRTNCFFLLKTCPRHFAKHGREMFHLIECILYSLIRWFAYVKTPLHYSIAAGKQHWRFYRKSWHAMTSVHSESKNTHNTFVHNSAKRLATWKMFYSWSVQEICSKSYHIYHQILNNVASET